jgi:two-component system, sensor histidine kinase and response regulator
MPELDSILVVDDNQNNLFTFEQVLTAPTRKIVTASSGEEALGQLLKQSFSIILLDIQMPDMDGFELAQIIRSRKSYKDVPIIFVTAVHKSPDLAKHGFDVGGYDYLHKPVENQVLISKVELFLLLAKQRRGLEQELKERKAAQLREQRVRQEQVVISSLLHIGLTPLELAEKMEKILDTVTTISWLTVQAKGSIFLVDESTELLNIIAQKGLPKYLRENCAQISFGTCLCGRAAATRKTVFASHIGPQHEITFDGIQPHGHYCLPIISNDNLLGVLNVYIDDGHVRQKEDDLFLETVAQTIAVIIDRNQSRQELRQHRDNLQKLVDEKTLDLRCAMEEAKAATETKSTFLANMSHEIRTPMNAVIGLTDLALNTDIPVKTLDYLTKIDNASRSLMRIINDILDFSKIEAGKLELEKNKFLIRDVFDHISDLFRAKSDEKGVELITGFSSECIYVLEGDALRLEQILMNLISNSIKFTEKGDIIVRVKTIEVLIDRVELEFSVADTGVGMSKEHMSDLFAPFVQADESTTRKFGGTGLGLSICKRLTELMGGRIWTESKVGKGTVFKFRVGFTRLAEEETGGDMLPPKELQHRRALVVDDNPKVQKVLHEMLNLFTFSATTVTSGQEALNAIQHSIAINSPYQLLIVDWFMPEMDGVETVEKIANLITKSNTDKTFKTIMLTSYSKEDKIIKQVANTPVDAYISKPVNCSLLFDTIMNVFGKDVSKIYRPGRRVIDPTIIMEQIGGAKILLVEDNAINRQVACEILQKVGLIVEVAQNGRIAVQKVKQTDYGAVLMDIHMPEMDGYAATALIRRDKKYTNLPIIAMTAHALKGDREKSLAAGMNDHVTKPIDKQKLFAVLTQWLSYEKPRQLTHPTLQKKDHIAKLKLPEHLPGINIPAAMAQLNNNHKLLRSLLLEFARDYSQTSQTIRKTLKSDRLEDINSAKIMVHTVKGIAGNLAAQMLFETAATLEKGIKETDTELLPVLLDDFEKQMQHIYDSADILLAQEE